MPLEVVKSYSIAMRLDFVKFSRIGLRERTDKGQWN